MPRLCTAQISLAYEATGRGTAVLFLHGAAMQLTDWPSTLIDRIAQDFRAIRFDLRDAGLSSKLGPCQDQSVGQRWSDLQQEAGSLAPYDLFDMAEDVVEAMDSLEIAEAHLVGVSMGGMIAQLVAAQHPGRVLSLSSLMSSAGTQGLNPTPAVCQALTDACSVFTDPTEAADRLSRSHAAYYGPEEHYDPLALRSQIERALARSSCPNGVNRQLQAILATGDRRALLRQITCPTLVVHGTADPCIDYAAAVEAQRLIADCDLLTIPGMGHEFTEASSAEIADAIHGHCRKAEARRSPATPAKRPHEAICQRPTTND